MELFSGCAAALVTPFDGDGIDFPALEALLDAQVRAGAEAVVVLGTTGEPATLTPEERRDVIACAAARLPRSVQLIVGAGANSTRAAIALAEQAERCGADALLVVTPYYNKASETGIIRHYTEIAGAVSLPVILYNVPGRTGYNLPPELAARLLRHPRIRGVKEASGSLDQLTRLAELMGEEDALYAGNDGEILPVLALGGRGVISVAANVAPEAVHAVTQAWRSGDVAAARQRQRELLPLVRALFAEVNPIPVKAALHLLGRIKNELRLPLCPLDEARSEALREALRGCGLLEPAMNRQ